jgi:hypothetical protein
MNEAWESEARQAFTERPLIILQFFTTAYPAEPLNWLKPPPTVVLSAAHTEVAAHAAVAAHEEV